ncbi:aspartate aminotransferase [Robbsia andropogonis]|uniref:pyridoxal phosphate-dependent aminotransferase n=1 Tax=Robbsia andropogonis TaxID=28092 RepID=UPI002A6A4AA5|nr:pyridoxal phosphate-dependent aminotransferase [Robbsia andropogonis]
MKFATRITQTSKKNYGMYDKATKRFGNDLDLIHLELGKPIADTPQPIKQATIDALLRGEVHYTDLQGVPALREALAHKLRTRNGLEVEADSVLVTNGLTHASFAAFFALLDAGDEVILLAPYYPQHIGKIEMAGGIPVIVDLDKDRDFAFDIPAIEAAITPRTRVIVLVNPSNPTGRVHTRDELQALADVAIRHDLVILADEVYEDNIYGEVPHVSIGALPGMAERTISTFAFTKGYAMDGWRIGYLCAPKEAIGALMKITASDVTHVNTFIQHGALAAITGPKALVEDMVAADRIKRDLVVKALNAMPGVRCAVPHGTMYAFPDIRATGLDSQTLADRLLDEAHVVVEAGSFYGPAGEGFLRICFTASTEAVLHTAMERLHAFFTQLMR